MRNKPWLFVWVFIGVFALAACQPAVNTDNTTGDATVSVEDITGGVTGEEITECANTTADALMSAGGTVYTDMCAGCHGQQGEGQGSFPALTANANVTADDAVALVQGFLNPEYHPFLTDMTTDEIASVLTYIRGSFGNSAAAVCPELIPAQ